MKYVDTNILVRLVTNDVPDMSFQASRMVESCQSGEIIVPDAVLVELFFVLEKQARYRLPRAIIVDLFESIILPTKQFVVSTQAKNALGLFAERPKLDFMDCLLAVYANRKNDRLLTFDKDLLKILN